MPAASGISESRLRGLSRPSPAYSAPLPDAVKGAALDAAIEASQPPQPLIGVTVVEYSQHVAGPYCARLLADAGARVIKVEPPQGDVSRRRGPFPGDLPHPDKSGLYHYLNAGKEGITLNLVHSTGRDLLGGLLKQADIFVEDNPPKIMEELGLDWASLHGLNHRLIVTSVTPFGQDGPYRDYQGDDLILAGMGGLAYGTPGFPDETVGGVEEPPLSPATPVAGFTSGVTAASATFMALFARLQTGQGHHVDVSQQATMAALMTWDVATASYLGVSKGRPPNLGLGPMPNAYLPCKDGYVAIVAFIEHHWRKMVDIMGNPEWAQISLFDTQTSRAEYWDALLPNLQEWVMAHTREEIFQLTQPRGVPCFPALEVGEAVDSDQVRERRFLREVELDGGVLASMPRHPLRFTQGYATAGRPAPRLGEHTAEVLEEFLGYDRQAISKIRALGVI